MMQKAYGSIVYLHSFIFVAYLSLLGSWGICNLIKRHLPSLKLVETVQHTFLASPSANTSLVYCAKDDVVLLEIKIEQESNMKLSQLQAVQHTIIKKQGLNQHSGIICQSGNCLGRETLVPPKKCSHQICLNIKIRPDKVIYYAYNIFHTVAGMRIFHIFHGPQGHF